MDASRPVGQDARPERAAVMLTKQEKSDLRFFADARNLTESDALRDFTIEQITDTAAEMREMLGVAVA